MRARLLTLAFAVPEDGAVRLLRVGACAARDGRPARR
jgi:phage I-like protein